MKEKITLEIQQKKNKDHIIMVRLDKDSHEKLKKISDKHGLAISNLVRQVINAYLVKEK